MLADDLKKNVSPDVRRRAKATIRRITRRAKKLSAMTKKLSAIKKRSGRSTSGRPRRSV